jgi:hypothetical protein
MVGINLSLSPFKGVKSKNDFLIHKNTIVERKNESVYFKPKLDFCFDTLEKWRGKLFKMCSALGLYCIVISDLKLFDKIIKLCLL